MSVPTLTLENPSWLLQFVLSRYRDEFFRFLLNGPTRPPDKERMKTAIDLAVGIIADGSGVPLAQAQHEINDRTPQGVQNIYATNFLCEILK